MGNQETKLTDILEISDLQKLQDTFAGISNIRTVIVDVHGVPITASSDGTISTIQTPSQILETIQKNRQSGDITTRIYPDIENNIAVFPLVVDGAFMGCWILGPQNPSTNQTAPNKWNLKYISSFLDIMNSLAELIVHYNILSRHPHTDKKELKVTIPSELRQWFGNKKNIYKLTPQLFEIINTSIQMLLPDRNCDETFQSVLKIVGQHLKLARSFIVTKGEKKPKIIEWCDDNITPIKNDLSSLDIEKFMCAIQKKSQENEIIIAPDIFRLSPEIYDLLSSLDIKSALYIPIRKEDQVLGFAGFNHNQFHQWTPQEAIILWSIVTMIETCLKQHTTEQKIEQIQSFLSKILDKTE